MIRYTCREVCTKELERDEATALRRKINTYISTRYGMCLPCSVICSRILIRVCSLSRVEIGRAFFVLTPDLAPDCKEGCAAARNREKEVYG